MSSSGDRLPGARAPGPFNGRAPGARASGLFAVRDWLGDHASAQVAAFVVLAAVAGHLGATMVDNMARVGITPGFAFLGHPTNFDIGESLIDYAPTSSFGRAILVGLINTIAVSVFGCLIATVLGVLLGVMRLSTNPLLSGSVRAYVELVRNTPLLLQLFVWNGVMHALPSARQALHPLPGVVLSNRGVFLPALRFADGAVFAGFLVSLGLVLVAAVTALRTPPARRIRRRGLATFAVAAPLIWTAGLGAIDGAASLEVPVLRGFNIAGGVSLSPEFAALLIGLVVNSAAGIAEIVRSGIESVPPGQWEAARALGLSWGGTMRLVVLPQAVRVIVPVMTSSYLSLAKNSSLAVAIGYPDVVSILNTTANQTGQALEAILIMLTVYLTISVTVSIAMNRWNARLAAQGARTS